MFGEIVAYDYTPTPLRQTNTREDDFADATSLFDAKYVVPRVRGVEQNTVCWGRISFERVVAAVDSVSPCGRLTSRVYVRGELAETRRAPSFAVVRPRTFRQLLGTPRLPRVFYDHDSGGFAASWQPQDRIADTAVVHFACVGGLIFYFYFLFTRLKNICLRRSP